MAKGFQVSNTLPEKLKALLRINKGRWKAALFFSRACLKRVACKRPFIPAAD